MVDSTFMIKKKNRQHGLDVALTWLRLLQMRRLKQLPLGRLSFCFRVILIDL